MTDVNGSSIPPSTRSARDDELARLRAENEELRRSLEQTDDDHPVRAKRSGRRRLSIAAAIMVAVLLHAAVPVIWTRNMVLSTDRFVETVSPLAHDPAVQAAVAARLSDTVVEAIDVRALVAEVLPPKASILAAPIAAGFRSLVERLALELVASDRFAELWNNANRVAHDAFVAALTGRKGAVAVDDKGRVVLQLKPVAEQLLTALDEQFGTDLSGRVPSGLLDVEFVLIESSDLASAQDQVRLLDRAAWLVLALFIAFAIATVMVAESRRRGTLRLGTALVVGAVVALVGVNLLRTTYLDALPPEVRSRDAAAAVFDIMVRYVQSTLRALGMIGVLLIFGAWVGGPSASAARLRSWWSILIGRSGSGLASTSAFGPVPAWIAAHARPLRIAAVVCGGVLLVTWHRPTGLVILGISMAVGLVWALVQVCTAVASAPAEQTSE